MIYLIATGASLFTAALAAFLGSSLLCLLRHTNLAPPVNLQNFKLTKIQPLDQIIDSQDSA